MRQYEAAPNLFLFFVPGCHHRLVGFWEIHAHKILSKLPVGRGNAVAVLREIQRSE